MRGGEINTDELAVAAAPPGAAATPRSGSRSRWRLEEGDEIAPGLSALKLLGGGLRYEAYLAWEEDLRAMVVAKVVRPALVEDEATLAGLRREMELLERLNHPIVVRGFGGRLDGPRPHLVLEHLEGPRLSSLLRRYGPLQADQLLPLAIEICAAIHYLTSRGLAHLDIKPSNLIMGAPPRLIDLSVARTVERCERVRSPVGTDAYMAPEQAACSPELGPAADVWGLGATLHEAASGERPFPPGERRSSVPERRFPQLASDPRPLPRRIPAELREPIVAAMSREPSERPSAAELGDRFQLLLERMPRPKLTALKPRRR